MIELDDDTRDALAEVFNMALGEASAQFAELVNEEIELAVPQVELVAKPALVARIEADSAAPQPGIERAALCRIGQSFHSQRHDLQTEAVLLFPERGSLEIVRRMLGESVSADDLSEMEQEALSEIGNIILNACFSAISDLLHTDFKSSMPTYHLGSVDEILSRQRPKR